MCQSLYFRFQRVIKRDNTSEETIYEAIIFGDRTEIFWITKDGISCCTYIHTKRLKEYIENGTWRLCPGYRNIKIYLTNYKGK